MPHPEPSIILNDIEINAAVAFFLHYMSMDQRSQLANEYPAIYNKLMGREYVKVVRVDDNMPLGDYHTLGSK